MTSTARKIFKESGIFLDLVGVDIVFKAGDKFYIFLDYNAGDIGGF